MSEKWTTVITPKNKLFDLKLDELWQYRNLIVMFVRRDFKTMYKQTILGPLWIIIAPILTTLMQMIVFGNIANISTDGVPQFLFYMIGNSMWAYFSNCLTNTSNTFVANAGVFGKVYFPRLVTPIAIAISGLITYGVQFAIILVNIVYYTAQGEIIPSFLSIIFPLLVIDLAILGVGCGLIISSLTTKYRDLTVLVTFGVQLWMYGSAVIFPVSTLPEKWKNLLMLNPVVPIIEAMRYIFTGRGFFSVGYLILSSAVAILILAIGMIIFNKVEKTFMDTV